MTSKQIEGRRSQRGVPVFGSKEEGKRQMGFRVRESLADHVDKRANGGTATKVIEEMIALDKALFEALSPLRKELSEYISAEDLIGIDADQQARKVIVRLVVEGLKRHSKK